MKNNRHINISKTLFIGMLLNLFLALGKVGVGFVFNMLGLILDGVNNLMDFITHLIGIISINFASKPADDLHPYGHGRFEYLGAFTIGVVTAMVVLNLLISSIQKLFDQSHIQPSLIALIILSAGIIVKGFIYLFYRKKDKQFNSFILKSLINDSLTDVGISMSLILIYLFFKEAKIDGLAGMIVSGFILFNCIKLLNKNMELLVGKKVDTTIFKPLNQFFEKYPDILGFHDIYAHEYGPHNIIGTIDIVVSDTMSLTHSHQLVDEIEHELRKQFNFEFSIHVDPVCSDLKQIEAVKKQLLSHFKYEELDAMQLIVGHYHDTVLLPLSLKRECFIQSSRPIKIRFVD